MSKKTYKNLLIIGLTIMAVTVILFVKSKIDVSTIPTDGGAYSGFLKPEQGAWSEMVFIDEENIENLQRSVYLGEKIIDNIPAYGVEMELIVSSDKSAITQVWLDNKSDKTIKIASKLKGKDEVVCVDDTLMKILIPSFDSLLPAVKTPVKYGSTNKYTYSTFTTKTGKTIQIAKFVDENNIEIWMSSEVPFGIVKVVDNKTGKIISYLRDFGLTGARAKISEAEIINCEKIDLPTLSE